MPSNNAQKADSSLKDPQTAAVLKQPTESEFRIRVRHSPAVRLSQIAEHAAELKEAYWLTESDQFMGPVIERELADLMILVLNAASDMGFSMQNEVEDRLGIERE